MVILIKNNYTCCSTSTAKVIKLNEFSIWFSTGIKHILDWQAYDHILFLIALCAVYEAEQWKKIIILITAFTIGHCITLALSVFNIININTYLIEFLIPITIIFTCVYNLWKGNKTETNGFQLNYFMALCFGFIHGMGFSTVLKSLLNKNENLSYPLFSFNLGIETAQLIIVFIIFLFSVVLTSFLKTNKNNWNKIVSSSVLILATIISVQRFIELIQH